MAETKDKVVTVESLSALHEHNKETYMTTVDPVGTGTMTMNGTMTISGVMTADEIDTKSLTIASSIQLVPTEDGIEIVFLNE